MTTYNIAKFRIIDISIRIGNHVASAIDKRRIGITGHVSLANNAISNTTVCTSLFTAFIAVESTIRNGCSSLVRGITPGCNIGERACNCRCIAICIGYITSCQTAIFFTTQIIFV